MASQRGARWQPWVLTVCYTDCYTVASGRRGQRRGRQRASHGHTMGTIQAKCLILKASRWIVHPMWTGYDLHGEQRPATGDYRGPERRRGLPAR